MENRRYIGTIAALLVVLSLLSGCFLVDGGGSGGGGGGGTSIVEPIAGWSGSKYDELAIVLGSGNVTIPSSRAGEMVLYVVTNYGTQSRSVTVPGTGVGSATTESRVSATTGLNTSDTATGSTGTGQPVKLRGHPSITAEYEALAQRLANAGMSASGGFTAGDGGWIPPDYGPDAEQINTEDFYHYVWNGDNDLVRSGTPALANLREIREHDGWRLVLWEMSDALETGTMGNLADAFLDPDAGDIFTWVSGVFGDPWGTHNFGNIIHPDVRDVHILLHDLDGGLASGVVVGLFAPIDSFTNDGNSDVTTSNEKLMFYINASQLSSAFDDVVSTLAHEFQHMIQFYQRPIRRGNAASYPAWLNELASMAAEDLVARKLEIAGPRAQTTAHAGTSGVTLSRLSDYNNYGSQLQLTTWAYNEPAVYGHYGTSYAFGAFLTRVYGAELMHMLLRNIPVVASDTFSRDETYDRWVVAEAVRSVSGTDRTFAELLRRWGIAMIVSDDTATPAAVRINRATWFTSSVGSTTYDLGSINAHNYAFPIGDDTLYHGPSFWNAGTATVPAAANRFVVAGIVPQGGVTLPFDLPQDVVVTVMTED